MVWIRSVPALTISKTTTEMNNSLYNVIASVKEMSITIGEVAKRASSVSQSSKEAGKGFSVVANEVRDLANQTSQFSKKVKNQISHFKLSQIN